MTHAREFRPRLRRSRAGLWLAAVLGALMVVGAIVLGAIALGSNQISYIVHDGSIVVHSGSHLDGSKSFPLAHVREAKVVELRGARRVAGTGAPGMCTGVFSYPELGTVWQATSCAPRGVLLDVAGEQRSIVLGPTDPEGFLAIVKAGTDAEIFLAPADPLVLRAVPGIACLLLVVTTSMIIAVFVAGPKRMRYVVGDGRLEVRTLFSRRSWPASELRARAHSPKVTFRLFGTAFPGYYTGLFRADGANTRMYATDLSKGVLVEGPARLFISPADPDAFLAALHDAGAASA